eukprot:gene25856-11528_t
MGTRNLKWVRTDPPNAQTPAAEPLGNTDKSNQAQPGTASTSYATQSGAHKTAAGFNTRPRPNPVPSNGPAHRPPGPGLQPAPMNAHARPFQPPPNPNKRPKLALNNTNTNIEQQLLAKQQELENLRKKMQQQEQLLKQKEEAAKAHEEARRQQMQQQAEMQRMKMSLKKEFNVTLNAKAGSSDAEMQRRKVSLKKGFNVTLNAKAGSSDASTSHSSAAAAPSKVAAAPSVVIADVTEVARVLDAKNDYECLKLHVGSSMAQVKKTYRQLAMALHPDKCKVEGASEAFQRVNQAYNKLSKSG